MVGGLLFRVATETSTLTVISVPGVAYLGAFGFVELAIGYLLGRSLVAFVLLPLYMRGGFVSAYQYLGQRFGGGLQGLAAVTFLGTRLLAEGVRLFASAIPIKLLLDAMGCRPGMWRSSPGCRSLPCCIPMPAASGR